LLGYVFIVDQSFLCESRATGVK